MKEAFFQILDRDRNNILSYEEWIGSLIKLLDTKDTHLIEWFVDKFNSYSDVNESFHITKQEFFDITSCAEVLII